MSGENFSWPWDYLDLDPYDADERAVKRAYARLLKDNRPDDDSEAFMALRKARDQALEELEYGGWDTRPAPSEKVNEEEDDDDDVEFFACTQHPAMAWVLDRRTETATGIALAKTYSIEMPRAKALYADAVARFRQNPDRWRRKEALKFIQDIDQAIQGGNLIQWQPEGDEAWAYSSVLGFLFWFALRRDHGWGETELTDHRRFLTHLETVLETRADPGLPMACQAAIDVTNYDIDRQDCFDGGPPLFQRWNADAAAISAREYRQLFSDLSRFYSDDEMCGYAEGDAPPEILIGFLALILSMWRGNRAHDIPQSALIEFIADATHACGIPMPIWLTQASMAYPAYGCAHLRLWRLSNNVDVVQALAHLATRHRSWKNDPDKITPEDVSKIMLPIAVALRAQGVIKQKEKTKIRFTGYDIEALARLSEDHGIVDEVRAWELEALFDDKIVDDDDEDGDDEDDNRDRAPAHAGIEPEVFKPIGGKLSLLLNADAPASRDAWEAVLDGPDVSDIDSAMALERWLRWEVLNAAGYWEEEIRKIPGFGAAQALMTQDRFGWGEPKAMASWGRDEREAMLKLFDLTRRAHFGARDQGVEGHSLTPPTEQGDEPEKKGSRFWKYLAWFGVAALVAQLLKIFGAGGS